MDKNTLKLIMRDQLFKLLNIMKKSQIQSQLLVLAAINRIELNSLKRIMQYKKMKKPNSTINSTRINIKASKSSLLHWRVLNLKLNRPPCNLDRNNWRDLTQQLQENIKNNWNWRKWVLLLKNTCTNKWWWRKWRKKLNLKHSRNHNNNNQCRDSPKKHMNHPKKHMNHLRKHMNHLLNNLIHLLNSLIHLHKIHQNITQIFRRLEQQKQKHQLLLKKG